MTETRKCLNRDVIKYIAIAAMFLNHVASIFITANPYLRRIFLGVGNFTAITMCYFLVEGYRYTRSKGKYMLRLLLFALVSQLPYSFAFSKPGTLQLVYFNMLFTLLLCFLICLVMDKVEHPLWKTLLVMGITACSVKCDWAFGAPVFTLLFIWSRDSTPTRRSPLPFPRFCTVSILLSPVTEICPQVSASCTRPFPPFPWQCPASASPASIMAKEPKRAEISPNGFSTSSTPRIC